MDKINATLEWHWFCPRCERSCLSRYRNNGDDVAWRVTCSECGKIYTVKGIAQNKL